VALKVSLNGKPETRTYALQVKRLDGSGEPVGQVDVAR